MITFIDPGKLKIHEEIDPEKLKRLIQDLKKKKVLRKPVVVDKNTMLILDGHHRRLAFMKLGIKKLPCFMVDYKSRKVKIEFRRNSIKNKLLKEIVLQKMKSGELFPQKTTKHKLDNLPLINYGLEGKI